MKYVSIKDFIRRNFPPGSAPHVRTVRRHICNGELPGRRIGAKYYVDETALELRFAAVAEKMMSHVPRAS